MPSACVREKRRCSSFFTRLLVSTTKVCIHAQYTIRHWKCMLPEMLPAWRFLRTLRELGLSEGELSLSWNGFHGICSGDFGLWPRTRTRCAPCVPRSRRTAPAPSGESANAQALHRRARQSGPASESAASSGCVNTCASGYERERPSRLRGIASVGGSTGVALDRHDRGRTNGIPSGELPTADGGLTTKNDLNDAVRRLEFSMRDTKPSQSSNGSPEFLSRGRIASSGLFPEN
jgi:hypothetical protein